MQSDPGAGARVAPAPAAAYLGDPRNGRIPFELLAAIAIVGAAAAGHVVEAVLVAVAVVLGRWIGERRRARAGTVETTPVVKADGSETRAPAGAVSLAERALSLFAAWFMPLAIASAAAVLMRTGDVRHALTLLLLASPQVLFALPASSRIEWRALAALTAAALLGAALGGFVGLVAAALLQQACVLAARFAP